MALLTGLLMGAIAYRAIANPKDKDDTSDLTQSDNSDKADSNSDTISILSGGLGGIIDDLF